MKISNQPTVTLLKFIVTFSLGEVIKGSHQLIQFHPVKSPHFEKARIFPAFDVFLFGLNQFYLFNELGAFFLEEQSLLLIYRLGHNLQANYYKKFSIKEYNK